MVRLEIVTPEAKTFSDNVDSVVIPGVEGELGVLPMHAPMMTLLEPGELRVMKNGEETRLAVGEGFVEITQEKIAVLTDMAVKESDIDEAAADEAIRRAEEAMRGERMSDEEQATTKAALMRSLALIKVKRRRHV
ncbi:MAG: ATP synthase F1 subunit epsilon [Verrucomicrobia bacterium]|jgi:F-type H+-transporting ATPase subunit epsilon|nr:ATP synthase F1 subunit epsilon [Verrucomicrobiota bacterium]